MLSQVKNNSFVRSVAVLASGTALAQAIPIAITPILTRLYSPEDFGLVALYVSCVSVLSLIATGRYELAITLPASDEDAANITVLTLKLCLLVSAALLVPIVLFGEKIADSLGNSELTPWLYLLPLSVVATSIFGTLQFWLNRTAQYKAMAENRVQNAALVSAANVTFGIGKVAGGQIWGSMLGQLVAMLWIVSKVWRKNHSIFAVTSTKAQKQLARRYQQHPKHLLPSQMIGSVAMQLPIFIMSSVYSLGSAGFFSMAHRLVTLPSTLVASAIGDVYRQRIAVAYQQTGEFRAIYLKTIKTTMLLAFPGCVVLYFYAPALFALVLGEEWRTAGEYARILVVAVFFQFSFTPIDKGAVLVGATRYIFYWHLARLALFSFLLLFLRYSEASVEITLWLFVIFNSALYITEAFFGYIFSKGKA